MTKSVLIVDDHAILRMGLKSLIDSTPDLRCVGEAPDGIEAIRSVKSHRPDVVVLDLVMPNMDGVETTIRILQVAPTANILVLTSFGTADGIAHALEAGARGAILKSAQHQDILAAIRTVASGKPFVSSEIRRIISECPPLPTLSPKQTEILRGLAQGLTNHDIALRLDIGDEAVKSYVANLLHKIGAANRAEAVDIAHRKHLLKI